jgi:hypothetical protein
VLQTDGPDGVRPAHAGAGAAPHRDEPRVLGPPRTDVLGPTWDEDEAVRRLSADPDRPLVEALLDQKNLGRHRQPVGGRDLLPARASRRGRRCATSTCGARCGWRAG